MEWKWSGSDFGGVKQTLKGFVAPVTFDITMGAKVTITVDEDLLNEAERATQIHDRTQLVEAGLRKLCVSNRWEARPFDFDAATMALMSFPELSNSDFEKLLQESNRPLPPPW
jgi:hypothetical protein